MLTERELTELERVPTKNPLAIEKAESLLSDKEMIRLFGLLSRSNTGPGTIVENSTNDARIERLASVGLIKRSGSTYIPTVFGAELYRRQLLFLRETLLKDTSAHLLKLSEGEERQKSLEPKRPDLEAQTTSRQLLEDIRSASGLLQLRPLQVFSDWLGLSMQTAMLIENMKEELFVATRYMDFRTAEIALNAAKLGRKINILHNADDGKSAKLQLLGNLMSNHRAASIYSEFTRHPNIQTREGEIPYSFVIVDRKMVEIEIVNPHDPDKFFLAFLFESSLLAEKLVWLYYDSFTASHEDKLKDNLEEAAKKKKQVSQHVLMP